MPDERTSSSSTNQRTAAHADQCATAVPDECASAASSCLDQRTAPDANERTPSYADECPAALPNECAATADADQPPAASLINTAEGGRLCWFRLGASIARAQRSSNCCFP